MKRKLRIGLRLRSISSLDISRPGNVQGDEQVARSWQKYLLRHEDVKSVHLYGPDRVIESNIDVLIHFHPDLVSHPKAKNIFYIQNAFPPGIYPGGVVGVFQRARSKFDGYMFTSHKLMEACTTGVVVPFATDPEIFFPQPTTDYSFPVGFVGNDIRGAIVNCRYFVPALSFGLVIYGNGWTPPLTNVCRGKLPAPDLPKFYSSVSINLNAHIPEHITWDTINLRIFDVLACEGFVLSDELPSLFSTFEDTVVSTQGNEDEWAKLVYYLSDHQERQRRAREGRKIVLSNHTYAQRVNSIVSYLQEVI